MNKSDALELKKRYKKESCTISKLAGCYVNMNKEKLLTFTEDFLTLQDEEFYKFMEIAKKTLSGTIGNNILELEFPAQEERAGGKQQFLYALVDSGLENEELTERLFDLIIEGTQMVGNFLILAFFDKYDVMNKTTDRMKLDESEEVYEHIIVSICPVALSKAALGYRADENRIGARIRDWVVGVPEMGFLFPAFDNRSSDIHKVDYYVRDAKDSLPEFVTDVLGCGPKKTATEQRQSFHAIVKKAFGSDEEKAEEALIGIQESFSAKVESLEGQGLTASSAVLDEDTIDEVLKENEIEESTARIIKEVLMDEFSEETPEVANLIDTKALEKSAKEREKKELVKEVVDLRSEIKEKDKIIEESVTDTVKNYDVVVRIKPDRAGAIHTTTVDGQKCLVIPVHDSDAINVNGVVTQA